MPQSGRALHEFLQWESQSWVEVVADMTTDEKGCLVPLESVKSYFAANDELSKITSEVFRSQYPPIDSEMILRDHTAIFCILLRIGQGSYIEHFARYEELSDRRLPFDPHHPPTGFPNDDPDFLHRFCERQWAYCVPILDGHMLHKHFGRQRLLPITYKELCGIQGMADTYVIQLYGPHNRLLPAGSKSQTNPNANTFLLKKYSKEGEGPYREEASGFRSVRHADGIIKFYGSYIHGDEFNILLEFADKGSLEEHFQRETPPSRGADIISFWEGLFQLIKGLKAIHSVREGHHDVKPESVLVLSNGAPSPSDWQFKFADFGLRHPTGRTLQDGQVNGLQDTPAYGAPECYMSYDPDGRGSAKITWAADIWSLGCIYSEAAVWIADGYKGLINYRKQRMAETDRILFKGGDCFHDGERVLQSVLDAHTDVEDNLRRSDYITKDVLESMVNEMLWEEDRPNAKALWRKSGVVLSRARQRLYARSEGEFPRQGSSQSRSISLPRLQSPAMPPPPVPPIPRGLPPGLSSIAERAPPNVEKWRSQVTVSQISGSQFGGSQFSGPSSDLPSPTFPDRQTISTESGSDLDRELTSSLASWRLDNSSSASPITPFTSPPTSVHFDHHRYAPAEGRHRPQRSHTSHESRWAPPAISSGTSYVSNNEWSDNASTAPQLLEPRAMYTHGDATSTSRGEWNGGSHAGDAKNVDEARSLGRSASRAGSQTSSSRYSVLEALAMPPHSEDNQRTLKQKRSKFSLFPTKSRKGSSALSDNDPLERTLTQPEYAVPRPVHQFSTLPNDTISMDYLSVNTCLEWKKAHKKVKKNTKLPPLPGAHMLESLKGRDHVFIVDDSASMAPIWPDMKRVFEALAYVLKDMSPSGTELFFTINYDTYIRKDTSTLCKLLDTNETIGNVRVPAGETNIAYRLNLQLESHCMKLRTAKYTPLPPKGKKDKTERNIRPTSFYILTNGEWGEGPDPKIAIQKAVDFLVKEKYTNGQVSIQFVSFASTPGARQKINDVAKHDFGLDIVSSSSSKDNVLKTLLGPLETLYASGGGGGGSVRSGVASSRSTLRSDAPVVSELG